MSKCGYFNMGDPLRGGLEKWAKDSGLPMERIKALVEFEKKHLHLSEAQVIQVRAEETFRHLETVRIRRVQGTFTSAQFNQWWALLWVLGERASHIQAEESARYQFKQDEVEARRSES